MEISPHSLTAGRVPWHSEFDRNWYPLGPAFNQCSTSTTPKPDASPRAISGRTSYLQVRLAFHLYPQLIPQNCNSGGFGPPRNVTYASSWPRVAHLVSGLLHATLRPIQTRFPYGSGPKILSLAAQRNSPVHTPKGTPSRIPSCCGGSSRIAAGAAVRRLPPTPRHAIHAASRHSALTVCRRLVSGSISLPFRGSFRLSLTVLVHYRSPEILSLGRWASQIPTGLHVSRGTQEHRSQVASLSPTGLSPSLAGCSNPFG